MGENRDRARFSIVEARSNHPGKQSPKGLNIRNISASKLVPFGSEMQSLFMTPDEATHAEIIDIIQRFGRSAVICKKAGFSGVEIHAAHGYLINQFLSPLHNLIKEMMNGAVHLKNAVVF